MRIFYRRWVEIPVRKPSFFGNVRGLMFRSSSTENLLFSFAKKSAISLHSWFVFFPFLVLWLDASNRVQEFRIVKPFTSRIRAREKFHSIVEIPLSEKNRKIVDIFVRRGKI